MLPFMLFVNPFLYASDTTLSKVPKGFENELSFTSKYRDRQNWQTLDPYMFLNTFRVYPNTNPDLLILINEFVLRVK